MTAAMTLECPHCQAANPEGARFCHNCGYALAGGTAAQPTTPAAQAIQTPQDRLRQYIPAPLLAKLEAARDGQGGQPARGVQGERRIVTVLFCDVKGSTTLAESLDPEEWAEIMNGAFK